MSGDENRSNDSSKNLGADWDQYLNEPSDNLDQDKDEKDARESPAPQAAEPFPNSTVDHILVDEPDDLIDPVSFKMDEILQQLKELKREFQGKLKYDSHKEKIIDTLHGELQAHKDDILKKFMISFVMDIIQFIDNLRKLTQHYSGKNLTEDDATRLLNLIDGIPTDLEDICCRLGVMPFTCEASQFDPGRQRVLKRIETDEEEKDKAIAESLRPGYEWDGKVIRPEMVAVYAFTAPQTETETRETDE